MKLIIILEMFADFKPFDFEVNRLLFHVLASERPMSGDVPTETAADANVANGGDNAAGAPIVQPPVGLAAPRPEELIIKKHQDTVFAADGLEFAPAAESDIYTAMIELVNSEDLKATQQSIYAYETGNAPLYRFMNMVLIVGEKIISANDKEVKAAFDKLTAMIKNEAKLAKKENRPARGIKNIGAASLPIINDAFIDKIRKAPIEVFKTLTRFYFPSAAAGLRAKYYEVINHAHQTAQPNFTTWIADKHEYTENGKTNSGYGITAAYNKIRFTGKQFDEAAAAKTDDELAKAFDTNIKHTLKKPEWLSDKDKQFFILGQIVGDNLEIVNITTSNATQMKSAVRDHHGSLFPSDFDYSTGSGLTKLRFAIQNMIRFVGPSELIMWQDQKVCYLMPTNEQWENDNAPGSIHTDISQHYAFMLRMPLVHDKVKDVSMMFPDFTFFDGGIDIEKEIFEVGYATTEIDKILKWNSDPTFEWHNDNRTGFNFMGASWYNYPKRHPKPRTQEDYKLKRTRLPSRAPYGFQYISGCRVIKNDEFINSYTYSTDVDFTQARTEFKKWVEFRTQFNISEPTEVVMCVKGGVIGIWYEPVKDANGMYVYNANQELIKIGTTSVMQLCGQWRVSVDRIRRVWGLIASGWTLYIPEMLPEIELFKEPNLSLGMALPILKELEDQPYGHMQDLCSTSEHDSCHFNVGEGDGEMWKARMCIPLVLQCNALWVYLYSKTD